MGIIVVSDSWTSSNFNDAEQNPLREFSYLSDSLLSMARQFNTKITQSLTVDQRHRNWRILLFPSRHWRWFSLLPSMYAWRRNEISKARHQKQPISARTGQDLTSQVVSRWYTTQVGVLDTFNCHTSRRKLWLIGLSILALFVQLYFCINIDYSTVEIKTI